MPTRLTAVDLEDFEDDSTDDFKKRHQRAEAIAQALGRAVAADEQAFIELLAGLVSGGANGRLWSFGRGLVEGAHDPKVIWNRLVVQLGGHCRSATEGWGSSWLLACGACERPKACQRSA